MCISNTPDTQVQEQEAHHHCHDEKGLGRTMLRLFDPSKSDTHDKPTSRNRVTNQQQQLKKQQQVDQSSSSSPTIAEPSEVSSISSTTKPQRTIPAFILRKQAKMRVPTMIVIRLNGAAQQLELDLGMSTNDAHLLDENDATTPAAAATETTAAAATRTATVVSDAMSTFSSWVQPNSETVSSNDDTTSTTSSNAVLSTFSSWVKPDSPNDNC